MLSHTDTVMSNHADLFQPLFLMRKCEQYHVMHVTKQEYEHIVKLNTGYWHRRHDGYMFAHLKIFTISKNGDPLTQADVDKLACGGM